MMTMANLVFMHSFPPKESGMSRPMRMSYGIMMYERRTMGAWMNDRRRETEARLFGKMQF